MYKKHFGFINEPFNITPDPHLFYCSKIHEDALNIIEYQLEKRRGFLLLTGDAGTGKTLISRTLLNKFVNYEFSLILNPFLNEKEILMYICKDFGLIRNSSNVDTGELFHLLTDFLINSYHKKKNVVLIVDEAQNLTFESFEMIRQISNIEFEDIKLVQIIFVGQLGLLDKINSEELKQLRQRIGTIVKLEPLTYEETENYIHFRVNETLKYKKYIFTKNSIKKLYKYSNGYPRIINQLAELSLIAAFNNNHKQVTQQDVEIAIKEYFTDSGKRKNSNKIFYSTLIIILIALFFLIKHISYKKILLHLKSNNVNIQQVTVKTKNINKEAKLKNIDKIDNKTEKEDNFSKITNKNIIKTDNNGNNNLLIVKDNISDTVNKIAKPKKEVFNDNNSVSKNYNVYIGPIKEKTEYLKIIKQLQAKKIDFFSREIKGEYYFFVGYFKDLKNAVNLKEKLNKMKIDNINIEHINK